MASAQRPVFIRNRLPVFGWFFATCFDAMLLAFLWIIVRDGWPAHVPFLVQWAAVPVLVCAALGLSIWLFGMPITEARIGRDRVLRLKRRWLLSSSEERIHPEQASSVQAFEETDSDGDPYFRCRLWFKDGRHADLNEGRDRERVAADVVRVRDALGLD
ncbi:MAG: hypothetical protein IPG63_13830 [Xanthomonadales bacterium]|nr:hypothetical protein [Xanthomonadales bacterium]MBK7146905.1 hypothetical protein [Xanthomonadales bacterium]